MRIKVTIREIQVCIQTISLRLSERLFIWLIYLAANHYKTLCTNMHTNTQVSFKADDPPRANRVLLSYFLLFTCICMLNGSPLYALLICKAAHLCFPDKASIALRRNTSEQEVIKVHGQLRVQGRQEDCLTGVPQSSIAVQSVKHDQLDASWFLCHILVLLIPLIRLCCL